MIIKIILTALFIITFLMAIFLISNSHFVNTEDIFVVEKPTDQGNGIIAKIDRNSFFLEPFREENASYKVWFYYRFINLSKKDEILNLSVDFSGTHVFGEVDEPWYKLGKGYWQKVPQSNCTTSGEMVNIRMVVPSGEPFELASVPPYKYSRYIDFVESLPKADFIEINQAGTSFGGRPIYLIKIGDLKGNAKSKYVVFIEGRNHPGAESSGSYAIEEIITYLTGNDARAKKLREDFIFYILPMTNPDGVFLGYQQCTIQGDDLYSEGINSESKEARILKNIVDNIKPDILLNFHGWNVDNSNAIDFIAQDQYFKECKNEWKQYNIFGETCGAEVVNNVSPTSLEVYSNERYNSMSMTIEITWDINKEDDIRNIAVDYLNKITELFMKNRYRASKLLNPRFLRKKRNIIWFAGDVDTKVRYLKMASNLFSSVRKNKNRYSIAVSTGTELNTILKISNINYDDISFVLKDGKFFEDFFYSSDDKSLIIKHCFGKHLYEAFLKSDLPNKQKSNLSNNI